MAINLFTICLLISVISLLTTTTLQAQELSEPQTLAEQLQLLQTQTGVDIQGLEKVQDESPLWAAGATERKLKRLLVGYNYISVRNQKGKVEKVVILGKKIKPADNRITLPVTPQGSRFIVSVALSGDGRIWETVDMVIDTGADLVVLPESMIQKLGMAASLLTGAKMQTANGVTEAKIGLLKELKIAGEMVENVEVAFVSDALLGNNSLLGMSLLGRYLWHLDENNRLLTLIKK